MTSSIYLLHRKPQTGLPEPQGSFETPDAAVAQMSRLVSDRTGTGEWTIVAQPVDADELSVLLQRRDGSLEAFFISEHHLAPAAPLG
jgi:hypothetical protein